MYTVNADVAYGAATLASGIRSRFADTHNGVTLHVLEAGFETEGRPCVLLLHGFPELAYSWRKVLLPLADAGFHVVAPDQRGYGRSGGTDVGFDDDLVPFTLLNHVRDALGLVFALGYRSVAAVVGHDYGSPVAAWSAVARPDVFRSVVLMSAPFDGPPSFAAHSGPGPGLKVLEELAELDPPRKHYQWYYSTRQANTDMWHCPQGVHDLLRGYYHFKSADWPGNEPYPLAAWSADELSRLPRYYVMDRDRTMAETAAAEMPSPEQIAACRWLTDEELEVYSLEYQRTGFQGGLQSYRIGTRPEFGAELRLFTGRTIDVPSAFISGARDWGVYQRPGRLERLQSEVCMDLRGVHLVQGAGHWVQQEQPEAVTALLVRFLASQGA
jgi:pimeloyl-ACP methyl ester carboxylesterase